MYNDINTHTRAHTHKVRATFFWLHQPSCYYTQQQSTTKRRRTTKRKAAAADFRQWRAHTSTVVVVGVCVFWHRFSFLHFFLSSFFFVLATNATLANKKKKNEWWRSPQKILFCTKSSNVTPTLNHFFFWPAIA